MLGHPMPMISQSSLLVRNHNAAMRDVTTVAAPTENFPLPVPVVIIFPVAGTCCPLAFLYAVLSLRQYYQKLGRTLASDKVLHTLILMGVRLLGETPPPTPSSFRNNTGSIFISYTHPPIHTKPLPGWRTGPHVPSQRSYPTLSPPWDQGLRRRHGRTPLIWRRI